MRCAVSLLENLLAQDMLRRFLLNMLQPFRLPRAPVSRASLSTAKVALHAEGFRLSLMVLSGKQPH